MNTKISFLIWTVLVFQISKAQNSPEWKTIELNKTVSVNVFGTPDSSLLDKYGIVNYNASSVSFIIQQLSLGDDFNLEDDTVQLYDYYQGLIEGIVKALDPSSQVKEKGKINHGVLRGFYYKIKMPKAGSEWYMIGQDFLIGHYNYGLIIMFPISKESEISDIRKKFFQSIKIAQNTKQFKSEAPKKLPAGN